MSAAGDSQVLLALAGGNALGAYAAGAYEAMQARGYEPHVIAGASIGAITGAIIAGNPPEQRVPRLRAFWEQAASASPIWAAPRSGKSREWYNRTHVLQTLLVGRPGLFTPRLPGWMSMLPWMWPDVAVFDNKPLVSTLSALVDFDYLNSGALPLIVSTVDLENGEAVLFDSRKQKLEPCHFLASASFIPLFPAVEVDGRCLGDPGLISNLPVDALLEPLPEQDTLCFAVDLFDSRGARPASLGSAVERAQDIAFSSQALRTIERYGCEHRLRRTIATLASRVTAQMPGDAVAPADLPEGGRDNSLEVVLLAYSAAQPELAMKTLEYSPASVNDRWAAGRADMERAIDKLEAPDATSRANGFTFYDARRTERR